ncbi:SPW repeat domain-containing protein [Paenibacillus xerothermodurans]|uniref:SPW repeat-containing integral membrane domain-containing protein n=1 Tax=Paenibacillus xerothermodurans TaxID=1977292 RepID=A0A2W1NWM5_PAEXE|nr:hypothetical protein [Paenibacillus xerothermodurans]PZE22126.1 hypothetical protein CBW46_007010 [Paenibacillus xerothermodurans]
MRVKNELSTLIGAWFMLTPWLLDFTPFSSQYYLCAILGGLQFLASAAAVVAARGRKTMVLNLLSILVGASFIIISNAFELDTMEFLSFEILAFSTIMINYSAIYPDS